MGKRLLALFCALSIMLAVVPSVMAEEHFEKYLSEEGFGVEIDKFPTGMTGGVSLEVECKTMEDGKYGGGISLFSQTRSVTEEDLYLYFVEVIENKELSEFVGEGTTHHGIDIRRFNIPIADEEMLSNAISRAFLLHPEFLIYNRWIPWVNGRIYTYIEVTYMFEGEEEKAQKQAMSDAIGEYKELAKDVPDTVGKILVIHDELAKRCRYATEEANEIKANGITDITQNRIFTGYGALVENVAVCQGYTMALLAILRELEIENVICINENPEVNHAWNIVKIDGEWYHLDATWNDSDTKQNGELMTGAYHSWFLITDEKTTATGHGPKSDWTIFGNENEISCTSTKYQSGHIFSGECIYNGLNYGSWYGNITYQGGRFKIDVIFTGLLDSDGVVRRYSLPTDYYSNTIRSNGMLASEPYDVVGADGQLRKVISYFATDALGMGDLIGASYEGTTYKGKAGGRLFNSCGAGMVYNAGMNSSPKKVMLWKSGTQEPCAEARTIR